VKGISFVFGIHNHQPVGNFDFVIDDVYRRSYLPFLEVLREFPKIKISIHNSGYLFEYLLKKYPKYKETLSELVGRGQVEILSGGFYEPIFPAISGKDRRNQILKLTKFIEDNFSYHPKGMWLSERVWEQGIVKDLASSGIEFTILDDEHFLLSGLSHEELYGYYSTEHEGYSISLFPISKELRYLIPFKEPKETIEFFKDLVGKERLLVLADDGEKFGVWPGTYSLVYEKGWLREFFTLLTENSDWIEILTFSEALKKFPSRGLIYLPEASYKEMMEWALPPELTIELQEAEEIFSREEKYARYMKFLRGTFWRNFLVKYEEANNMHKRMIDLSQRCSTLKDAEEISLPYEYLMRAQANDAYWHGVFGGLYLPHLRSAIYRNLIEAEKELDKISYGNEDVLVIEEKDIDKDGKKELIAKNQELALFIKPSYGGAIFEIDYRKKSLNITDTLKRRFEAYHKKIQIAQAPGKEEGKSIHEIVIAKEKNLENYLIYDWHNKYSLMDHFLKEGTTCDSFYRSSYGEQGDFTILPYDYSMIEEQDLIRLSLKRKGHIWVKEEFLPLDIGKDVTLIKGDSSIRIDYSFENKSFMDYNAWFGTEFNFSLFERENKEKYIEYPDGSRSYFDDISEKKDIEEFVIFDNVLGFKIGFTFDIPIILWHYPIDTVSQSEGGFERTFQGLGILISFKQLFIKNEIFPFSFNIKFETL